MNTFYVYILKCNDNSYYVGHTDNIESRIAAHQQKTIPCYTNSRLPISVMFIQDFGSRDEAFSAERQIKKWTRKKKEALIEQNWSKVSLYAKKIFSKK